MDAISYCHKGDIRPINEDRVLVKKYTVGKQHWGLFLVADGMGGGRGGIASQTIVDVVSSWWDNDLATILSMPYTLEMVADSLDVAIAAANSKILALQTNKPIGSTLSLLLTVGGEYIARHIGDTRIYLVGETLQQLTTDHDITHCLGTKQFPSIQKICGEYTPQQRFFLCSKGYYQLVPNQTIFAILQHSAQDQKLIHLQQAIPPGAASSNLSIIATTSSQGGDV